MARILITLGMSLTSNDALADVSLLRYAQVQTESCAKVACARNALFGEGTPEGLSVRSPREPSPSSCLTGGELDDRKTTYNLQVQIKRADSNKLYMKCLKGCVYLQAHASIHWTNKKYLIHKRQCCTWNSLPFLGQCQETTRWITFVLELPRDAIPSELALNRNLKGYKEHVI